MLLGSLHKLDLSLWQKVLLNNSHLETISIHDVIKEVEEPPQMSASYATKELLSGHRWATAFNRKNKRSFNQINCPSNTNPLINTRIIYNPLARQLIVASIHLPLTGNTVNQRLSQSSSTYLANGTAICLPINSWYWSAYQTIQINRH